MIDTHTHLYDSAFGDIDAQVSAVDRAVAAGIETMLLPAIDGASIEPMRKLAQMRPDNIRRACALHPTELGDSWEDSLAGILHELTANISEYVAVGECGIDLYWDKTTLPQQMQIFDSQLAAAQQFGLPAIIHCRNALDPTLEVLQGHPDVQAVFHSFGGTVDDIDKIRRTGDYYFGINGIVTFKNSGLSHVLPAIGLQRVLLETDSPYLAPVPYRGKRNESAYIPIIAFQIARAFETDTTLIAAETTKNAIRLIPGLAKSNSTKKREMTEL